MLFCLIEIFLKLKLQSLIVKFLSKKTFIVSKFNQGKNKIWAFSEN